MKHIFLNLKRFDIKPELGGVNRLAEPALWGETVASSIKGVAEKYGEVAEFAAFLPEAHLIGACAGAQGSPLGIGCQGVHGADTAPGGNFIQSRYPMQQFRCQRFLLQIPAHVLIELRGNQKRGFEGPPFRVVIAEAQRHISAVLQPFIAFKVQPADTGADVPAPEIRIFERLRTGCRLVLRLRHRHGTDAHRCGGHRQILDKRTFHGRCSLSKRLGIRCGLAVCPAVMI